MRRLAEPGLDRIEGAAAELVLYDANRKRWTERFECRQRVIVIPVVDDDQLDRDVDFPLKTLQQRRDVAALVVYGADHGKHASVLFPGFPLSRRPGKLHLERLQ